MKRRAIKHVGLIAALGALLPIAAMGKEGDTFQPFASLAYVYDSNLFRLAEIEMPGRPRDDRYSVIRAGVDVDWKLGRQELLANATKTWVRYDRNSAYDADGNDYGGTWNWRLGNRLSGNLGASESLSQSAFDSVGQVNNLVTRNRQFGRVEWELHPRWRIGGGAEVAENANSALSLAHQDFRQWARDATLSYRTPKGSSLRAQVRRIDSKFPLPQILAFVSPYLPFVVVADNSYTQTEYNLLGDWRWSGKLTVHGQAGWVDRRYDNILRNDLRAYGLYPALVPRPDFSGFNGRLTADWYATGKTLLSASLYQELGGAQDINASSVLNRGGSVNGVWVMREKWRLNAGLTFVNRDFRGDPGSGQIPRNDDTWGTSLSVSYTPLQTVSLDVGVSGGRRDSNTPVDNYKFHSVFANLRAEF